MRGPSRDRSEKSGAGGAYENWCFEAAALEVAEVDAPVENCRHGRLEDHGDGEKQEKHRSQSGRSVLRSRAIEAAKRADEARKRGVCGTGRQRR